MIKVAVLLGSLLVAQVASAQICNPVCASQPAQCCGIQADTFLAEECTGVTSAVVHFVVTDGTAWLDLRLPATFDVSGLSGSIQLGNSGVFGFTIGTSFASARFQIVDSTLTVVGQCVGTSGNTYSGFQKMVVADNRALSVSGRNPLFCREPTRDLLCFQVKGQVGPPFQAHELCDPDRVEYACGVVE